MTLTAVVLLLVSALTHAGWNLLGKREHPSSAFFLLANTTGVICLAFALIPFGSQVRLIPPAVWGLLVLTGSFQALYMVCLASAYRRGDLSIVYPIARSSPVIVVTVVTLFLGRGDQVSTQCIGGIALIVGGCFVLPMVHIRDLRLDHYLNFSALYALIAAIASAGYAIVDDEALRILRDASELTISGWQATILYGLFEGLSTTFWLGAWVLGRRRGRTVARELVRTRPRPALLAGVGMYFTYVLVLISLAYVANVSYVVAFRQLSIPIGAVAGILFLNEPGHGPRYLGIAAITAGLALVGTG